LGLDEYKTLGDLLKRSDLRVLCGVLFMEYVEKPKRLIDTGETPLDKVIIDMMNELRELKVSATRIYSMFDRYDVIERSRTNLIKKYHELMDNEKIQKEKLTGNDLTSSVYEYLGLDENQKKIDESKKKEG
jgi:predicted transcriptional regulator